MNQATIRNFIILFAGLLGLAEAQIFKSDFSPSNSGSSSYMLDAGMTSLNASSVSNHMLAVAGLGGKVQGNVNLLTRTVSYEVPILEFNPNGDPSYSVGLNFSGATRPLIDLREQDDPTGWIGFGWSLETPYVAVNNKGTVTTSDDIFVCNLGEWGGGQLIVNESGVWTVTGNPNLRVELDQDPSTGLIKSWTITNPEGVTMTFGETGNGANSERTFMKVGALMTGSPTGMSDATPFVYRWDVRRIADANLGKAIFFEYRKLEAELASGKTYTRESHVSDIYMADQFGGVSEGLSFHTETKSGSEFRIPPAVEIQDQPLYETQYLSNITHYFRTNEAFKYYTLDSEYDTGLKRRVLKGIQVECFFAGHLIADPNSKWAFEYSSSAAYSLTKVTNPHFGFDEFEYENPVFSSSKWNQEAQQEMTPHEMEDLLTGKPIELPADNQKTRNNWENETQCGEKFCLFTVADHSGLDYKYFEIWPNSGTHFNGYPSFRFSMSIGTNLKVIPWNDNFLLIDEDFKLLSIVEWNGEYFDLKEIITGRYVLSEDGKEVFKRTDPASKFFGNWKVTTGGSFFTIQEKGYINTCTGDEFPDDSKVYVFLKDKRTGEWRDVNERECVDPVPCKMDNSGDFGEVHKHAKQKCMEFRTKVFGGWSSASSDMLAIADDYSIIHTYILNPAGDNFINITGLYQDAGDGIQLPDHPANWKSYINEPIRFGNDYFLVRSVDQYISHTGPNKARYDVMHFDGKSIRRIATTGWETDHYDYGRAPTTFFAWPAPNYFITANHSTGKVNFWEKQAVLDAQQKPKDFTFAKHEIALGRNLLPDNQMDLLIRTHPNAFTVEFYANDALAINGEPKRAPMNDGQNYITYIFKTTPGTTPGYQRFNPTQNKFRDDLNRNLFNVSFSGSDNIVVGNACKTTASGLCAQSGTVDAYKMGHYTALVYPGKGVDEFIDKKGNIALNTTGQEWWPEQETMSSASRIGARCILDLKSRRVKLSLLANLGEGFSEYPFTSDAVTYYPVVKTSRSYTGLSDGISMGHKEEFRFDLPNNASPAFNTNIQALLFPSICTYVIGSTDKATKVLSMTQTSQYVDLKGYPISVDFRSVLGKTYLEGLYAMAGTADAPELGRLINFQYNHFEPVTNRKFPVTGGFKSAVLQYSGFSELAPDGSATDQLISYVGYENIDSPLPAFSKTNLGSSWILKQNIFDETHPNAIVGTATFKFDEEPKDKDLLKTSPSELYKGPGAAEHAIAADFRKLDPIFALKTKTSYTFRDNDPTLTDDDLKDGVSPKYLLGQDNLFPVMEFTKRNAGGQALESKEIVSKRGVDDVYSSYVYDGARSALSAQVFNCRWSDMAYLSAETERQSGPYDQEGKWEKHDAGVTPFRSHTGERSIKVKDDFGPAATMELNGIAYRPYDYVVSVWIFSENTKPFITVDRVIADGATMNLRLVSAPKDEAFKPFKWQRYEVRIPYTDLVGEGNQFFQEGSGDRLRVQVGCGPDAGTGPSNTLYVDDVLCVPSDARYHLKTYNSNGTVSSETGVDQISRYFDYDYLGNLTNTRDDKYRIYDVSASHLPGEND